MKLATLIETCKHFPEKNTKQCYRLGLNSLACFWINFNGTRHFSFHTSVKHLL